MFPSCLLLVLSVTLSTSVWGAQSGPQCPSPQPNKITAPKTNIWKQLTKKEAQDVNDYLIGLPEYNFKAPSNITTLYDNYINDVELWKPTKADALNYLDNNGPVPERWARATVVVGNATDPFVESWLVGPLPIGPNTTHIAADAFFTRNRLPWNAKPVNDLEAELVGKHYNKLMKPMDALLTDLFGGNWSSGYLSFGDDGAVFPYSYPYNGSDRAAWTWLQIQAAPDTAWYLYPLPFYVQYQFGGQDETKWGLLKIVYDNVVYTTAADFIAAWQAGKLTKYPYEDPTDYQWALRTPQGPRRKYDNVAGPVQVQFDGPRYDVDEKNKYVDYQGWTFYLGYDFGTGLRLWDISFKGERIIYELGAEDAIADYAGKDPATQATAYLDGFADGLGASGVPLAQGYDCPQNAIFWNTSYAYGDEYYVTPQGVCIFEHDAGFPASRHTADTSASTTKNFNLNVRWVATVGNYDYLFNYIFYPEGTIEVQVMASGYIQATYWYNQTNDEQYGSRMGPYVMGAMHDHIIPFKVDFDLAGTENSFEVDTIEIEENTWPWSDGRTVRQKHLVAKTLATEDEGRIDFGTNGLSSFKVINTSQKNKWGHPRGYRIQPGMNSIRVTDPLDPKLGDNSHWADHNINVVRYHDTERSCTGNLNQLLPVGPQVDFSTFFNSESLDQEDFIVYFNLGMHHIPRSEDLPTTIFINTRSSMLLSPWNWKARDESSDTYQSFYAVPNKKDTAWVVDNHGVSPDQNGCAPPSIGPLSLSMIDEKEKHIGLSYSN